MDDIYVRLNATFIRRETLGSSLAIVGGTGALGNEIAKCLAMLGFGRVLLVDRDRIEGHNVTRSVLLGMGGDLDEAIARGTPKAEYVARGMRTLNPDVAVAAWVGDAADLGIGVFQRAHVVFSGFDNLLARYVFMKRCAESGRSMIDGGLGNSPLEVCQGEVVRYDPASGACLACRLGVATRAELAEDLLGGGASCGSRAVAVEKKGGAPSTPMMASIVGGAQVLTGIKALMSDRRFPAPAGVPMRFDLTGAASMPSMKLRQDPECPLHAPRLPICPAPTVRLPASSDRMTLHDLAAAAEERLGPGAVIWLPMNMVTDVVCKVCEKPDAVYVQWNRARDLTCRHCSAGPRTLCTACGKVTSGKECASCASKDLRSEYAMEPRGEPVMTFSRGDALGADQTLRALGFPVLHIFQATSADASRTEHIEVTGDFERYFTFATRRDTNAQGTSV